MLHKDSEACFATGDVGCCVLISTTPSLKVWMSVEVDYANLLINKSRNFVTLVGRGLWVLVGHLLKDLLVATENEEILALF